MRIMSMRSLVLLMMAGLTTGWAFGGEPAGPRKKATTPSIAEQAAPLLQKLGSDDFEIRQQAAHDLEALGPAVLPILHTARYSRDPEVRRLAQQVAERLNRTLETARVLEPKRVRVAYRDVPLNVVIQDFQRATGVRIHLDGVKADRKVTFDSGYTTFWDAFDKLCSTTGLTEKIYDSPTEAENNDIYYGGGWGRRAMWRNSIVSPSDDVMSALLNGQFVLTESKTKVTPPPSYQVGALRFRALPAGTSLGRVSTIKGNREVIFGLEILPEPALAWDRVLSLHIDRAIDEHGQRVEVMQASTAAAPALGEEDIMLGGIGWDYPEMSAGGNNGGQRVPLRLKMGNKASTVLKELSGVATIKMHSATEAIATVDRIMDARNQSVRASDGSSVKIVDVQRQEGGKLVIQVKIDSAQTEGAVNPWGWNPRFGMRMYNDGTEGGDGAVSTGTLVLFDARGHLVRLVHKEQIPDENGMSEEYKFTYQPAKGQPEPAKLVLQGRRPVSINVPFTLKDVPLKAVPGAAKSVPVPAGRVFDGPISQTPVD
jgi:hypothetical protein